jgi:hypothetical protein
MSAVGIALATYFVLVCIIFDRLNRWMFGRPAFRKPPPLAESIEVYGVHVPLLCILILWLFLPTLFFAFAITRHFERRYWEAHNQCGDCGCRLVSWRGRCPKCGNRIGPG